VPKFIYAMVSLLVVGVMVASKCWATDLRYAWTNIPNALYYSGTFEIDQQLTKFVTRSNWIILERPGLVKVQAVTSQGIMQRGLVMQFPSPLAPLPPQQQRRELAPEPKPVTKKPSEPDLSDDEVISNVLEHGDAAVVPVAPAKRMTRRQVAFTGALGHEALRATGGITDYSASALVAGALVSAAWANAQDFWYVVGTAELHRLNVSEQIVATTPGGNGQSSSTFLRAFATAGVYYDLLNSTAASAKRLGFGLGVAYLRLPMLQALPGASQAHFKQQNAYGPFVGIDFSESVLGATELVFAAELMPMTFVRSLGALAIHVQGAARRPFAKNWSGLVTLDLIRHSLSSNGDCPAVANCADQMSAYSTVFLTSVGVAYHL